MPGRHPQSEEHPPGIGIPQVAPSWIQREHAKTGEFLGRLTSSGRGRGRNCLMRLAASPNFAQNLPESMNLPAILDDAQQFKTPEITNHPFRLIPITAVRMPGSYERSDP